MLLSNELMFWYRINLTVNERCTVHEMVTTMWDSCKRICIPHNLVNPWVIVNMCNTLVNLGNIYDKQLTIFIWTTCSLQFSLLKDCLVCYDISNTFENSLEEITFKQLTIISQCLLNRNNRKCVISLRPNTSEIISTVVLFQ